MFSQTGREDFWGTELSSKKKVVQWPEEDADESEDDVEHTLFLHYACLGIGAKTTEPNIITLTTQDSDGEELTLPIAYLSGNNPQVSMRLPVSPPVILKLAQGSGPVAIGGVHEQVLDDIGLSDEAEDQEEQEEMSSPEVKYKTAQEVTRKRPAPSPAAASAGKKDAKVMKKKEEEEEEEDEGSDDDDEDDESSGEELDRDEVIKYLKAKGLFNGAGMDDEEDDGEDDDEEDEDEDDDDEEEGEDSEEEEMEQLPVPKKKQAAKQPPSQPKAKDTSQAPKQQKGKTPQSAKKGKEVTPAAVKATPKGKPTPASVDQVKAKLLKSPNLPKKPEKFANFVKNTFKIDDASVHKQLWEFVQKSKK